MDEPESHLYFLRMTVMNYKKQVPGCRSLRTPRFTSTVFGVCGHLAVALPARNKYGERMGGHELTIR